MSLERQEFDTEIGKAKQANKHMVHGIRKLWEVCWMSEVKQNAEEEMQQHINNEVNDNLNKLKCKGFFTQS